MNKKGFTLIETIIYIAIIGGLLTSFISFGLTVQEPREKTYGMQEAHTNARSMMQEIVGQIRNASGVNTSTSVFESDPGVLSLQMSSSTINPTIFSLDIDNGNLQITQGILSSVVLNSNKVKITNLNFTNLTGYSSKENIKINLTVETVAPSTTKQYGEIDLQTSVNLRK